MTLYVVLVLGIIAASALIQLVGIYAVLKYSSRSFGDLPGGLTATLIYVLIDATLLLVPLIALILWMSELSRWTGLNQWVVLAIGCVFGLGISILAKYLIRRIWPLMGRVSAALDPL
jgi:membrane-bound metal-dependent hydrolase YbcI (DUF457 family)